MHHDTPAVAILDAWLQPKHAATAAAYRRTFQQFIAHVSQSPISNINPGDILNWKLGLRQQGRSPQTIANSLSRIACFFDYAVTQGLHPGPNPARAEDITRPRTTRSHIKPLSLEQIEHVLITAGADSSSGARACAIILIALAGAKPGNLRWSAYPTLPPAARVILDRYADLTRVSRDPDDYIFVAWKASAAWRPHDSRAPISRAQISNTLGRLSRRAGLPPNALSLRTLNAAARHLRRTPRGQAALERLLNRASLPTR